MRVIVTVNSRIEVENYGIVLYTKSSVPAIEVNYVLEPDEAKYVGHVEKLRDRIRKKMNTIAVRYSKSIEKLVKNEISKLNKEIEGESDV